MIVEIAQARPGIATDCPNGAPLPSLILDCGRCDVRAGVALLVKRAGAVRRDKRTVLMRGYAAASLVVIGVYALLPGGWGGAIQLVVFVGALACVVYGRRKIEHGRRGPWTLLLWSLAAFVVANLVLHLPGERALTVGRLIDTTGYLLLLAGALAFIVRPGASDLGGVIDAAVIALAAGTALWVVLPHRLGPEVHVAAQAELFVVLIALAGIFGVLLRLATVTMYPGAALWWLLTAIGLVVSGDVAVSLAGTSPILNAIAIMLLMGALTAIGLFGLDPSGPNLAHARTAPTERLSTQRLVLMSFAVAVVPVVIGTRAVLAGDPTGVLLAFQGIVIAGLVMVRIGLLSAQSARAEQTLQDQASRDPLTHLPNRRQFVARLTEELGRGSMCAVVFCDLDGFKVVNDRFGHDAGDGVLVEVASRFVASVGPQHLVSRFGGDEFAVLLVGGSRREEEAVQERILSAMARPIKSANGVRISVSVGVAHADGARDAEDLIRSADKAMYRVKASHRRDRYGGF